MKYALCPALVAICALAAFTPVAKAVDGRAAYGDEKTDFYLATVPAGEKYERRYLYFGVWSNFYRVNSDSGERGGPGCLRKKSASLSRASAEVRLPCGVAAG